MYAPNPKSMGLLGRIAVSLSSAAVVPNEFSPAPRYLARLPGGQLYFDSALELDTDGWPQGGQMGDPDWQAQTSLRYANGGSLDANAVPYFVLPLPAGWAQQFGIVLGDYAAVILDGRIGYAVFGDQGPRTKLGEGSLALLRQLGEERLRPDGTVINAGTRPGVITIVFPRSGAAPDRRNEAALLNALAQVNTLFVGIGGVLPGVAAVQSAITPRVAALLNPAFAAKPLATVATAGGDYHIVSLGDRDSSGQALVWQPAGRAPKLLKTGTTIFPLSRDDVPASDQKLIAGALASHELGRSGLTPPENRTKSISPSVHPAMAAQVALRAQADHQTLNEAVFAQAEACDGTLDTSHVPQTDAGNLACAWAVNEVVRRATGQTISQELLSTDDVYDALAGGGRGRKLRGDQARAGSIIISPSVGKTHGHVGILGEGGVVYSNSSSKAMFQHSYTITSWKARYNDALRLKTYFFDLDPAKFGFSG